MNNQRRRIKYLYANKQASRHDVVDIAILTCDNEYLEYTLEFRQKYLTMYVTKRIRSLFSDFILDSTSDIAVNERIIESHPLYQYFMILHQHINFKFMVVDLDKIVSRIHYFYSGKSCKKIMFKKVWKTIVDKKQCPWIDENVDLALKNQSVKAARRVQVVRMAMFYLIVKTHLYSKVKKSINLRKIKSNSVDCI